ncbi:MAG: tetratricopeptide repeat protein [Pirellulaceae bacterium]|nr:tetratricopeptide repeat protein [Planctomycetales bacterium]
MFDPQDLNSGTLEDFVDALESAHATRDAVDLRSVAPMRGHPEYRDIVTEMVRVDLEYGWRRQEPHRLEYYLELFPDVFENTECVSQVAFEEYRLRHQAGQSVSSDEYRRRFNVDSDRWPKFENLVATRRETPVPYPQAGQTLFGFTIVREIGRGSFARVYLVSQNDLANRFVVLKVSPASGMTVEPQYLARLQHANIVPIYSVHQSDGLLAICMPYVGEWTLADVLRQITQRASLPATGAEFASTIALSGDETVRRVDSAEVVADESGRSSLIERVDGHVLIEAAPSSPSRYCAEELARYQSLSYVEGVLLLISQVAGGLAHAHRRGIVHRDLKPANILISDDHQPMLLDFNLSDDVQRSVSARDAVGGTLPYMSPEHLCAILSGGEVSRQADVYSLGVILFELVTGRRPFAERTGKFADVVKEMVHDRKNGPPLVRSLNPAVSPAVAAIVERCMAVDPTERYLDAGQLHEDLQRQLQQLPLVHAPNRSLRERLGKWLRRHPRWTSASGVGAMAAVMLLAVLAFAGWRGRQVAQLNARETLRAFHEAVVAARIETSVPESDPAVIAAGLPVLEASLGTYDILNSPKWQEGPRFQNLDDRGRALVVDEAAELLYLLARSHQRLAELSVNEDDRTMHVGIATDVNELAVHMYEVLSNDGDAIVTQAVPVAIVQQSADLRQLSRHRQADDGAADDGHGRHRAADVQVAAESSRIDRYMAVLELLDQRDYDGAIKRLDLLLDEDPTNPSYWLWAGKAYMDIGNWEQATAHFKASIKLHPESFRSYFLRGLCYLQSHDFAAAENDFQRVIRMRPDLPSGWLNRALAYRGQGQLQKAADDLQKAMDLKTTQTRVYFVRAQVLRELGDLAGADADFQQGLTLTPSDEESWIARGVAKLNTDPEAALQDFQLALQRYPRSVAAMRNLLHVWGDVLREPDRAREILDRMLDVNGRDVAALGGRAVLAARAGDCQRALADAQRLRELPQSAVGNLQLACVYAQLSKHDRTYVRSAVQCARNAFKVSPALADIAAGDDDMAPLSEVAEYRELLQAAAKLVGLRLAEPTSEPSDGDRNVDSGSAGDGRDSPDESAILTTDMLQNVNSGSGLGAAEGGAKAVSVD